MGTAIALPFEDRADGRVRVGLAVEPPDAVLATAIATLDAVLPGGGLPVGRLTEVTGKRASGKLSLVLAIAAAVLERGDPACLVDPGATLAPPLAGNAPLGRLLVVRGGGIDTALRAADALLRTRAFPLLALDLPGRAEVRHPVLVRLARECRAAGTALLIVSEWLPWRSGGIAALASLRLETRWRANHREVEVQLTKSKLGNEGSRAVVGLASPEHRHPARSRTPAPGGPAPCAPSASA